MKIITVFIFTFLIAFHEIVVGQAQSLNAKEWVKKLADPSDKENKASFLLDTLLLIKSDSAAVIHFLDQLDRQPSAKGHYFVARYNCLKVKALRKFYPVFSTFVKDSIKREVTQLVEQAMQEAFIVDDDYLAAYVSSVYGAAMADFQNTEKAVMYMMYSADLYDKVGLFGKYTTYMVLGEMLWRVREYNKSIRYTKIAIPLLIASGSKYTTLYEMMCNNTIALSYHRMENYDSANYYYNKALELSSRVNHNKTAQIWYGIISGNMAQIDYVQGKYTTALPFFEMGYQSSKENGVYDDAANSIQWAAKTNLALGNKAAALQQVRESFNLLQKWPTADNYRQNAYQTASEIFKALGNADSAYYYSEKYNALHDSIEKTIYESSISISKLRLDNEKNRYKVQNLEREKKAQLQTRNFIIAAILLLCAIGLLLINRQRQKSKLKAEIENREKRRIEQEMKSAREQLKMFTKSIIEKTNLIEKLESQMENKLKTQEQQQLIEELSRQSILTEEDWLNFKSLFQKLHAGFFEKINKHVNNITQAEQRMAALTLLHLTTKQIANVLGISPNSVIKAKHRMRDRFNLQSDQEVENFIVSL